MRRSVRRSAVPVALPVAVVAVLAAGCGDGDDVAGMTGLDGEVPTEASDDEVPATDEADDAGSDDAGPPQFDVPEGGLTTVDPTTVPVEPDTMEDVDVATVVEVWASQGVTLEVPEGSTAVFTQRTDNAARLEIVLTDVEAEQVLGTFGQLLGDAGWQPSRDVTRQSQGERSLLVQDFTPDPSQREIFGDVTVVDETSDGSAVRAIVVIFGV